MPTLLNPPREDTPANQHPVHSQQQTTVYIGKDVTATPKIPVPQYTPEKIVIPISSLFPGEARRAGTLSTAVNTVEDGQETKGEFWIHRKYCLQECAGDCQLKSGYLARFQAYFR